MPTPPSATIGHSTRADATQAGAEAAKHALEKLTGRPPKLAIVFGSSWLNQRHLLEGVRSVLGETPLTGGSTAGEIVPEGPTSHGCVVVLLAMEGLACGVGIGKEVDRAPREAGQRTAYTALKAFGTSQRAGLLLFGDGLLTSWRPRITSA